jgi:hypothetical protein
MGSLVYKFLPMLTTSDLDSSRFDAVICRDGLPALALNISADKTSSFLRAFLQRAFPLTPSRETGFTTGFTTGCGSTGTDVG